MLRLAILASGRGSNFAALADAAASGALSARIVVLICNVPGAPAIAQAEARGIPVRLMVSKGAGRAEHDALMAEAISAAGADLVVLAGYMRLLTPEFIRRFTGAIVNIHPSLLPAFPGLKVHEAVLAHGCKISGCTVHYVDEGLDSGPIIAQAAVPVLEGDTPATLAERVHEAEHRLYPWALERIARNEVRIEGRRVRIL